MGRALLITWAGLMLAGCHRYVPARIGAVPAGTDVRVHVTPDAAERIADAYGTADLEGRLESWSDEVVVTIPVPAAPGMLDRGLRNRVIIPAADVLAVEVRERDPTRSAILAGGIGVLVIGAAIAAFTGVFGGTRNTDPPIEEDILIPLWLRVFP